MLKEFFYNNEINWLNLEYQLSNDVKFFTQFPFDLSQDEVNNLSEIIKDEQQSTNIKREIPGANLPDSRGNEQISNGNIERTGLSPSGEERPGKSN